MYTFNIWWIHSPLEVPKWKNLYSTQFFSYYISHKKDIFSKLYYASYKTLWIFLYVRFCVYSLRDIPTERAKETIIWISMDSNSPIQQVEGRVIKNPFKQKKCTWCVMRAKTSHWGRVNVKDCIVLMNSWYTAFIHSKERK